MATRGGPVHYVTDGFLLAAAGVDVKEPQHPGETMAEYREHKAHRLRFYKALTIGLAVLLLVAVAMYIGVMR